MVEANQDEDVKQGIRMLRAMKENLTEQGIKIEFVLTLTDKKTGSREEFKI